MANLKDLVLIRNDPEVAMEFLQAALAGDVDAQYGLGLIYAEGRGVEQDEAKAFFWLTLAHEQGDEHADELRKVVAAAMTGEQLARADALLAARTHTAEPSDKPRRPRAPMTDASVH